MSSVMFAVSGLTLAVAVLCIFVAVRNPGPKVLLSTGLRIVGLLLGSGALLGSSERPRQDSEHILVLADVSASIPPESRTQQRDFIAALARQHGREALLVWPFAARPLSAEPLPMAEWTDWERRENLAESDHLGTDLVAAMQAAAHYSESHPALSVLLSTDGQHTADAIPEDELRALAVPTAVHALPGTPLRRRISDFITGQRIHPGTPLLLSARIHAGNSDLTGRVEISATDGPLPCADAPEDGLQVRIPARSEQLVVCRVDAGRTASFPPGLYQLKIRVVQGSGEKEFGTEAFLLVDSGDAPLLVDVPAADQPFWREALSRFSPARSVTAAELVRQPPTGKVPLIVLDGSHAQLDGATGPALAEILHHYVSGGGWLVAAHGSSELGLDQLAETDIESLLPLRPLSNEDLGQQALLAVAVDVSDSMFFQCPTPAKLGNTQYDDTIHLARDLVKMTVSSLAPGDRLALYRFADDVHPLGSSNRKMAAPLASPAEESLLIQQEFNRLIARKSAGGTDLCVALRQLACTLKSSLQPVEGSSEGGSPPPPSRGSLFVVTDAGDDVCAQEWVSGGREEFRERGPRKLRCDEPNTYLNHPTLGDSLSFIQSLHLTPYLVVLDPCGWAGRHEHPYYGEAHIDGRKQLVFRRSPPEVHYAGPLRVHTWWQPDKDRQLVEFLSGRKDSLGLPTVAAGAKQHRFVPGEFRPSCGVGIPACEEGLPNERLPRHQGSRECRLAAQSATPILFRDGASGGSRGDSPVAAMHSIDAGTVIAVATDPAWSFGHSSFDERQELVNFWRSILRDDGTARLDEDLFIRLAVRPAGYHFELFRPQTPAQRAKPAQLLLRVKSATNTIVSDVLLKPDGYLHSAVLPAAQLSSCKPCKLSISPVGEAAGAATASRRTPGLTWPTLNLFSQALTTDSVPTELSVEGQDELLLQRLATRLRAVRISDPAELGVSGKAAAGAVAETPREASLTALCLALLALLLAAAIDRGVDRLLRRRERAPEVSE